MENTVAGDGQLLLLGFVLAWQPAGADKMFRVAANMNETYYGSEEVQQRKSNLVSDFSEEKPTLRVLAVPSSPPTKDEKEKGCEETKESAATAHQQSCPMVPRAQFPQLRSQSTKQHPRRTPLRIALD